MNEDGRFEILVYPENGDGVNTQTTKLAQRDIDGIDLVIREVPHVESAIELLIDCLLYTSPSPRDVEESRMPSSA